MQLNIQRIQEKMQELRRLAVELDEELAALRNEIDANLRADVIQGGFGTALPDDPPEQASGAPCGPKVEGGDAA